MNTGFINEKELREYINQNTYDTYNQNIKNFLSFIFGKHLNTSHPFVAEKIGGQVKPDLCIKHNGLEKNVSIKKGGGNSVHQESIDIFFPYMETIVDTNFLNILKKFHYGDDTINDTGKTRYNANQCKSRYKNEISILNTELNKWTNLCDLLDRFLFIGNVGTLTVDIVYHGTIDKGLWATRDEIIDYVKNNNFINDTVHFGPLTYQVWGRNEKGTAIHPDRRYIMQVKWGSIVSDFKKIRNEVNNV